MSDYKKPLPQIEDYSQAFWDGTREGKLLVQVCNDCDSKIFFPRKQCPECWSGNLGWIEASGNAEIYAFSVTNEGVEAAFMDDLPIVLAWVDLPEGIRMQTNIVDCDPEGIQIGQQVEVVFKKATDEITLPYFRPAQ